MPERRAFSLYPITGYPDLFEQRLGKCYEIAAKVVAFQPDAERDGWLLVHGSIKGPEKHHKRIPQAWVMLGNGFIWEVVLDEIYANDVFYKKFRTTPHESYTPERVRMEMLATGNYGPWGDEQ